MPEHVFGSGRQCKGGMPLQLSGNLSPMPAPIARDTSKFVSRLICIRIPSRHDTKQSMPNSVPAKFCGARARLAGARFHASSKRAANVSEVFKIGLERRVKWFDQRTRMKTKRRFAEGRKQSGMSGHWHVDGRMTCSGRRQIGYFWIGRGSRPAVCP